jgi:hypothetical protein
MCEILRKLQNPCLFFFNLPQTVTIFLYMHISTVTLNYEVVMCSAEPLNYMFYRHCYAIPNYQTVWSRVNALDFYSGSARFWSWPGHRLSSQVSLLVLDSTRIITWVGLYHFLSSPLQFTFQLSSYHQNLDAESASLNNTQTKKKELNYITHFNMVTIKTNFW